MATNRTPSAESQPPSWSIPPRPKKMSHRHTPLRADSMFLSTVVFPRAISASPPGPAAHSSPPSGCPPCFVVENRPADTHSRTRMAIAALGLPRQPPAVALLLKRGRGENVKRIRLESLSEGSCIQMLHVGRYDKEDETVAILKAFGEQKELEFNGKHHEIYRSDPRRVPAKKLRTILRVPVVRAGQGSSSCAGQPEHGNGVSRKDIPETDARRKSG